MQNVGSQSQPSETVGKVGRNIARYLGSDAEMVGTPPWLWSLIFFPAGQRAVT